MMQNVCTKQISLKYIRNLLLRNKIELFTFLKCKVLDSGKTITVSFLIL